ncbi:MAG TPA: asparagine synthase-related protein, partial [Bryobacteraceae bacterium]|nr:asparagine synthase-related protein [Bryobacteraceae bacterium]
MSMHGASPGFPAFPMGVAERSWKDESIALGGSDDCRVCIHEKLVLLLEGRPIRDPALSRRLGTSGDNPLVDILEAYRRWGEDFPRYLQGDFAVALWDSEKRRLVLARDPGGYWPLHYWVCGNQFRFASEARELLANGDIPLAANPLRIAQWLSMLPDTSGSTFFQSILSVPPGHTVIWERGQVCVRDFWRPAEIPELRLADPREYAEGLRSVLEEAVRSRIEDFSAVGSHLSGGLDSSSVTATAASLLRERGGRVTAYTAVPTVAIDEGTFPRRFCDESSHAAATAALYPNVEHVLIPTISGSLFETLDLMTSACESPQLNPGNSCWFRAICTHAMSRGLRVMLTGANGNFTISYDGRRALSSLIAGGRLVAAMRLGSALRRGGAGWRRVMKAGVRPLLPAGLRRALDGFNSGDVLKMEDATGLRPEFAVSFGLNPQEALERADIREGRALRTWSIRRNDFGSHMAGLRRLTGVEQMDPTSDRRVMEFCLSVP